MSLSHWMVIWDKYFHTDTISMYFLIFTSIACCHAYLTINDLNRDEVSYTATMLELTDQLYEYYILV
jgi:hypothetical protein